MRAGEATAVAVFHEFIFGVEDGGGATRFTFSLARLARLGVENVGVEDVVLGAFRGV